MKKHLLTVTLALGIICITGCSKHGLEMQTTAETNGGVSIYEGDKRVIFNLSTLPYDMEYKGHILQFSSCELYQEKSDVDYSYTPYVVAKVKIDGIDDETLHWFNEDLYVYGNLYNDKNQFNSKELSKICEIDNEGYRYYVFSQSLLSSHDYGYDFSESFFYVGFLILQGEDFRTLQFIYDGSSSLDVKDLKDVGEEVWYGIKQKQLESEKPKTDIGRE
ncbi:hypothetical protein LAD12857_22520 [Lacrimispora amygdalina]|uniref:Lipoprotein n=1 Tax=Lacrimispora amygdalina TaxID=253257 RepID=A0ABQ5M5U3_9FIRM